jgi:hypothetical protein
MPSAGFEPTIPASERPQADPCLRPRGHWDWLVKKLILLGFYAWGAQIFEKSRSHLKILGVRRVTWCTFHTQDPQILDTTIQNFFATATWLPGYVNALSIGKWLATFQRLWRASFSGSHSPKDTYSWGAWPKDAAVFRNVGNHLVVDTFHTTWTWSNTAVVTWFRSLESMTTADKVSLCDMIMPVYRC